MKKIFTLLFLTVCFFANAQQTDTIYNHPVTVYRQMVKNLDTLFIKQTRDVYYAPERESDKWTQVEPKDKNEGWIQVVPKGWNNSDSQTNSNLSENISIQKYYRQELFPYQK